MKKAKPARHYPLSQGQLGNASKVCPRPTAVKAVARPSPNAYEDPAKLKAGEFVRGEQILLKFQANQPGTYRMICEVHTFIGPKGELQGYDDQGKPKQGPMVAYITVLP